MANTLSGCVVAFYPLSRNCWRIEIDVSGGPPVSVGPGTEVTLTPSALSGCAVSFYRLGGSTKWRIEIDVENQPPPVLGSGAAVTLTPQAT